MKKVAFSVLILMLLLSMIVPAFTITSNTLFFATLVVLLALFSDLKNFDFWGLKGTKYEPPLRPPKDNQVIGDRKKRPSKTTIKKAEKTVVPPVSGKKLDTFVGLAYEVERLLRIMSQAITAPNKWGTQEELTQEAVLALLEDEKQITHSAADVIRVIRSIRSACFDPKTRPSDSYLDLAYTITFDIYTQLEAWLKHQTNDPPKAK